MSTTNRTASPTDRNPTPTPADPIQAAGEIVEDLHQALGDGDPDRIAAAARRLIALINTPRNVPALLAWLSWLDSIPGDVEPSIVVARTCGAAAALLWRQGWE